MSEYITKWIVKPENKCIREEIVRCRDCKHYDAAGPWCCEPSKVFIDEYGIEICANVRPDGFCAWGERDTKVVE